jgi:hypothetical protein
VAIETGEAFRPRRGTYACAHLDPIIAVAARVGGALSCVTVLRAAGVWSGHGERMHLQLPPSASRLPSVPGSPVYHREVPRFGMHTPWQVSRMQALWQAMHCLDTENAIAAMESAIHEKFLPAGQVMRLAALAPRRLSIRTRELVLNSGSGNETIVRLRLHRMGYQVESQGRVPGMGHQDLVVEDCLGLEIDSRQWHAGESERAIDYDRDLHVAGLGRRTLRILPAHIHAAWPQTLAVIGRAMDDAKRERDRRDGRVLVSFGDPV